MDGPGRLPVLFPDHFFNVLGAHEVIVWLVAEADDRLRLDGLVARAAFRVEKAQKFSERFDVSRIPEGGPRLFVRQ